MAPPQREREGGREGGRERGWGHAERERGREGGRERGWGHAVVLLCWCRHGCSQSECRSRVSRLHRSGVLLLLMLLSAVDCWHYTSFLYTSRGPMLTHSLTLVLPSAPLCFCLPLAALLRRSSLFLDRQLLRGDQQTKKKPKNSLSGGLDPN